MLKNQASIMNWKIALLILSLSSLGNIGKCQQAHLVGNGRKKASLMPAKQQAYFTLNFKKGDSLANIYSRTIAYSGNGFYPVVFRVSGTSFYKVLSNNGRKPVFDEADLYDGQPESNSKSIIGLDGSADYGGKPFINSSASGLLYSELIWGYIHTRIHLGDSWKNEIVQQWELGGPGTQVIKVLALDEKNETVTLQREGYSSGFFDSDQKQIGIVTKENKKLTMSVAPGKAHWIGYTTFRNGVILSDELLVTRKVELSSDSLHFKAIQREYILLNAMPASRL